MAFINIDSRNLIFILGSLITIRGLIFSVATVP